MAPLPAQVLLPMQLVQADIAALAIGGFVSFALIVWDFITFLPDELRLIKDFRKVSWRSPDPFCFYIARYGALGFCLSSLFTLALKTEYCQAVYSLSQFFSIAIITAAGILCGRRMASLWGYHFSVVTATIILFVAMFLSWVAVASQHRTFKLEDHPNPGFDFSLPAFGSNCGIAPLVPWHFLGYITASAFFFTTFSLSLLRWMKQRTEHVLNLGMTPLNRACLWYLAVSWAVSMVVLIVHASPWPNDVPRRTTAPLFILMIAAMAQRLFLNSQADYKLRKKHIHDMATMKLEPKVPRWSWSPNGGKKASISTFSTATAGHAGQSPRMVPVSSFGGNALQVYPRPPPPPPPLPMSPAGSTLSALPPQHIESLSHKSKSRATSIASSVGKSSLTNHGRNESDQSQARSSNSTSTASHSDKLDVPRVEVEPETPSNVTTPQSGFYFTSDDIDASINPVSAVTSPNGGMSTFSQAMSSPMSVSTIGFGSPPGSPPVLAFPWPGGRPPPNSKKALYGSKPAAAAASRRGASGSSRSRSRSVGRSGNSVKRMPSLHSGWMN